MLQTITRDTPPPTNAYALVLRDALRAKNEPLAQCDIGELAVDILKTSDPVFAVVRRAGMAFMPVPFDCKPVRAGVGEA